MRTPLAALIATVVAAVLLIVWGPWADDGPATPADSSAPATPALSGTITVLAAASLTETFTTLGAQFEAAHPGTTITLDFGPSSGLASQITAGAPADVFAAASDTSMRTIAADAHAPTVFAANVMEIAVPPDNPAKIRGLGDLARPDVKVALCQSGVPCGAVAATVLVGAGLKVTPVTWEVDVKAALTKVELGEVDAAIVYVTDVHAAGHRVSGIEIPAGVNAATDYPIATLTAARNPALAQAFVDDVLSAHGKAVLGAAGFRAPRR